MPSSVGLMPEFRSDPSAHARSEPGPEAGSDSWHGFLELRFERRGDRTILAQEAMRSPLKIQRPFYPDGPGVCHGLILHTAGGMVGGDRLDTNVVVGSAAAVVLTTATAGKVYRSTGRETQQTITVQVGAGASLAWLPQETILFESARFRQDMHVVLEPGATWLAWEIVRLGRSARGERFLTGQWRSRTQVWQGDRPLWIDAQHWPGSQGSEAAWQSPHGLGGWPVVASLVWLGQPVSRDLVSQVRQVWLDLADRGQSSGDLLGNSLGDASGETVDRSGSPGETGATRLDAGLLCRYRGPSTARARAWFEAIGRLLATHGDRS